MMPAAKMFDPIVGIDVHIIQPPGPVPPIPIPHPHTGMLFDPFDFAPIIGATIKVNGIPRAVAGSGTQMVPPHIPIGGVFVKPPANDSEMFMGSMTVLADGDPFSYLALPLLSCWDIGMPPFPRPKRSPITSMVLPTTVVLSIPSGVMVGGPPIPSFTAIAQRLGFGPLLALYQFATTGNPLALLGLAGPALKGLKALNRKFKIIKRSKCGKGVKFFNGKASIGGDPVDLVTGAQFHESVDAVEPGGLFALETYYSTKSRNVLGPLGRGFKHTYEQNLEIAPQAWRYRRHDDLILEFDPLTPAQPECIRSGFTLRLVGKNIVQLEHADDPRLRFLLPATTTKAPSYAKLHEVASSTRTLQLRYNGDQLASLHERDVSWVPGRETRFACQYDDRGRLIAVWRQEGAKNERLVRYAFDSYRGLLLAVEDAEALVTQFSYDDEHRMTLRQDPGGYAFSWVYDDHDRCIETRGSDGLWAQKMAYFPARKETHQEQDGGRWIYRYDANERITEIVQPDGTVRVRTLDAEGQVRVETDASGRDVEWLYDEVGVHYGRRDFLGNIQPTEDEAPDLPDPTAPRWPQTPAEREFGIAAVPEAGLGAAPAVLARMPVAMQQASRAVVQLRPLHASVPPATTRVDRLGRTTEERDSLGRVRTYRYGHSDHPIEVVDADHRVYTSQTRRWDLVTAEIDPLGHETQYEYNGREQVTRIVDALGNVTEYDYDPQDRITQIRRDGAIDESYRYDGRGCLHEILDGRGNPLMAISYDRRGLVTQRKLASGGTHTLQHDALGNPILTSTDRHDVEIERDFAGRVRADRVDGVGVEHSWGGEIRTTTILGRFEFETSVFEDDDGALVFNVVDPSGAEHVIVRDDSGLVFREHQGGVQELGQYDGQGQLVARVQMRPSPLGSVGRTTRYLRSAEGDLLEVHDSAEGVVRYLVDQAHRLVGEVGAGAPKRYRYDAAGNLLETPLLQGVAVGPGNRLLHANGESFVYDHRFHLVERHRGQLRTRYTYDGADMLVAVDDGGEPWTAEYDAWGRRLQCGRGDRQTKFYWDGERLAAEVDPGGGLRIYVYPNAASMQPMLVVDYDDVGADPGSGRVYTVHYDAIGLPKELLDCAGNVAWRAEATDVYGRIVVASEGQVAFNLRWPGHYFDAETGLHYNRWRYYDPVLGRYLQSDPIGQEGDVNVYAYPANPLRDVDVFGLAKKKCSGGGASGKKKPKKPKKPKPKLTAGEVDSYRAQKRKNAAAGKFDRDHIPSKAAVAKKMAQQKGRPLTKAEKRNLDNNLTTAAINQDTHKAGRTYGSKNTANQTASDAGDLQGAAKKDLDAHRDKLKKDGMSDQEIADMEKKIHDRNQNLGVYNDPLPDSLLDPPD